MPVSVLGDADMISTFTELIHAVILLIRATGLFLSQGEIHLCSSTQVHLASCVVISGEKEASWTLGNS